MIDLVPGAAVGDGRYRLKRRLGAGGMASVWLALDERLHREVAVKLLADTLASDERYLARFDREARAAASLSDPHVVPVYDYGVQDGRPFLVMEYIAGGNLAMRLASEDAAPDARTLAHELLGALTHIHDAGLVHRDIKPANILLDARGRARLTDFGIAQAADATSLTQTGMVIGTLRYLAPEVADGAEATPASDLFSAGVVLREAVGRAPAPALEHLIRTLTAALPADRPASAAAALRLLDEGADAGRPNRSAQRRARTGEVGTTATSTQIMADRARTPGSAIAARLAGRKIPRETAWAVAAMTAVIVILIAIAITSEGSPAHPAAHPASPGAPIGEQLRALTNIVNQATKP